jgi:hypothetical protein
MREGQTIINLRSGIQATIANIEPETNTIWLNLPGVESEVDYDLDTIKTLWSFEEIDERQIKRDESKNA